MMDQLLVPFLLLKIQFIMLLKLMGNGVWLKPWTKLKKDGHLLIISKNVHQMKPKIRTTSTTSSQQQQHLQANGASNPISTTTSTNTTTSSHTTNATLNGSLGNGLADALKAKKQEETTLAGSLADALKKTRCY